MTAAILALVVLSPRPSDDALALLDKVRAAYQRIHSALYYAKFETSDPAGLSMTGDARIEFGAPNQMRAAFRGMSKGLALVICDGKTIAMIGAKGSRKDVKYSAERLGQSLPLNVETLSLFDAAHELSASKGGAMYGSAIGVRKDVEWNGKKWTVLRETSAEDNLWSDYFIDPKTDLIWRTYGMDLKTNKPYADVRITQMEIDPRISSERFKLPVPKSIRR